MEIELIKNTEVKMDGAISEKSALHEIIQRASGRYRTDMNIKIAIDALNRSMRHYDALYAARDITDGVYEFAMRVRVNEQTKLMALLLNNQDSFKERV